MSLVSVMKVFADINQSMEIKQYNDDDNLDNHFYKKVKKNFFIDLKFGIHLGWCIESVIGSSFKIDAMYLSPSMELTRNLLNSTYYYNCNIVISEE